jgi:hypothetical protein
MGHLAASSVVVQFEKHVPRRLKPRPFNEFKLI